MCLYNDVTQEDLEVTKANPIDISAPPTGETALPQLLKSRVCRLRVRQYDYLVGPHLPHVLLLLLPQRQLNEDLLQLLIAVVDDKLLKAVVL